MGPRVKIWGLYQVAGLCVMVQYLVSTSRPFHQLLCGGCTVTQAQCGRSRGLRLTSMVGLHSELHSTSEHPSTAIL